jgi:hypothetical protein
MHEVETKVAATKYPGGTVKRRTMEARTALRPRATLLLSFTVLRQRSYEIKAAVLPSLLAVEWTPAGNAGIRNESEN